MRKANQALLLILRKNHTMQGFLCISALSISVNIGWARKDHTMQRFRFVSALIKPVCWRGKEREVYTVYFR